LLLPEIKTHRAAKALLFAFGSNAEIERGNPTIDLGFYQEET